MAWDLHHRTQTLSKGTPETTRSPSPLQHRSLAVLSTSGHTRPLLDSFCRFHTEPTVHVQLCLIRGPSPW